MDNSDEKKRFAVGISNGSEQVIICMEAYDLEDLQAKFRAKAGPPPRDAPMFEGSTNPDQPSMVMVWVGPGTVVSFLGPWTDFVAGQRPGREKY